MMHDQPLRFARYRLDGGGLWRGKREVRITPKALAVLRVLVDRAGKVVSKQELFDAVWPDTVVSDAALSSCIKELRQVLGDDARHPRYLETLHRRGYRFASITAQDPAAVAPPIASPTIARSSAMVDRDRELGALRTWLDLARVGVRQIVFVTGEPGIGKTTLVEAFLAEAAGEGELRIARGQCVDHYGPGEPYLPILEALARLGREPGGEHVVHALARHAPTWLVQMPALISTAELRAIQRRAQAATRERMLRELTEAIEALTTDRTLILRLEDLHWSDVSTLDWLAFAARRPERARLLVIGTYRPVEVRARNHSLESVTRELQLHRQGRELAVRRLDETAVAAYLARRCPFEAPHEADRLGKAIHARTEGNPLFMVTVVDDLVAREVLVEHDGRWTLAASADAAPLAVPADVGQMIERQLGWLSPFERAVLDAASVVGATFSAAAVATAGASTSAEIEACCAALARREQFIRVSGTEEWPDGTLAARFAFLHALYQEVLYANVPAGLRVDIHARVGERLERAYGAGAPEIAAGLAMHFERSRDSGRSIQYLEQAGLNAIQRHAPNEAILHLHRALELIATLPETPARAERELSLQTALGSQLMTLKGWGAPEVERAYARASALGELVGDAPRLFPALWGLWLFSWGQGDMARARVIADDLFVRAGRTDDAGVRLEAHHALWATLLIQGELMGALDHASRGFALYDAETHASLAAAYGNHDPGMCSRGFGAWTLLLLGFPERALAALRQATGLSERLGHPFNVAWGHYYAAFVHQFLRDPGAARAAADAALALAREHGFGLVSGWMTAVRGWAIAAEGETADGIADLERGLAAARATGSQRFQSHLFALLADAFRIAGRSRDGLVAVEEGLAIAVRTGERFYEAELWRLHGELLLHEGRGEPIPSAGSISPESCFLTAHEIARRQGAKWFELRAATSLRRLQEAPDRAEQAQRRLLDVYGWFTEGLERPDLRDARALLTG
jgi:DNA-binding winged helix-turn-helix (wHTH) protein/predicted ATPase